MTADLVTVEWALVAMAVAAWLQVLLFLGLAVGTFKAWQRTRQLADEQLAAVHTRIDEVTRDVKTAVRAVDRVADRTGALVLDTGNAARVAGRLDTLLARVERAADRLEAEAREIVEAGAEAIPSGRRTNG